MMSRTEHLLVLLSIVAGLAITDLLQSLHRLVRAGSRVRWHWLPLVWAVLLFVGVIQFWWAYYRIIRAPIWSNLFAFLLPLTTFVVLYLLCAAALPDPEAGESIDLETFYFSDTQRRWFFGLLALMFSLAIGTSWLTHGRLDWEPDSLRFIGLVFFLLLAWSRNRILHMIAACVIAGLLAAFIFAFTLRLS